MSKEDACCLCGKSMKLGTGPWAAHVVDHKFLGMKHLYCAGKKVRRDPEAVIQEYGAEELSKTKEGRSVLENARQKYKAELTQPGDPSFKAYWGKDVARREREMAEVRAESQRLKREAGMA